jgi:hypothetical protein
MKKPISILIICIMIIGTLIPMINAEVNNLNQIQSKIYDTSPVETYNPTDDAEVSHISPNTNLGGVIYIDCRYDISGAWGNNGLLKFDISDIPSYAIINSATFYIYYVTWFDSNPGGTPLNLYRITSNWNEGTVTWNNQPGHYGSSTDISNVPSSTGSWMSYDVTDDVEDFVDGTYSNYGWKFIDETSGNAQIRFYGKENGAYIPYLEVDYIIVGNAPTNPLRPSGPTTISVYQPVSYETVSTDADLDTIKYGWDWDGDQDVDQWTSFYDSGEVIETSHSWNVEGTFNIRVKAEDINGLQSDFSSPLTVVVTEPNDPPYTPETPTGDTVLLIDEIGEYLTYGSDPDNDYVRYGWDWNGDDTVDEWTGYYASAQTVTFQHAWVEPGSYDIKVKLEDDIGAQSEFSDYLTVYVSEETNEPPNNPSVSGEISGESGVSYVYNVNAIDPENDDVSFMIDWGDGNITDWQGPYSSGSTQMFSHVWTSEGTFILKVKARDVFGLESDWASLEVTMPYIHPFIKLIENSRIFEILQFLFSFIF